MYKDEDMKGEALNEKTWMQVASSVLLLFL